MLAKENQSSQNAPSVFTQRTMLNRRIHNNLIAINLEDTIKC